MNLIHSVEGDALQIAIVLTNRLQAESSNF